MKQLKKTKIKFGAVGNRGRDRDRERDRDRDGNLSAASSKKSSGSSVFNF